eukprot:1166510-Rhodomonas_salina.1
MLRATRRAGRCAAKEASRMRWQTGADDEEVALAQPAQRLSDSEVDIGLQARMQRHLHHGDVGRGEQQRHRRPAAEIVAPLPARDSSGQEVG